MRIATRLRIMMLLPVALGATVAAVLLSTSHLFDGIVEQERVLSALHRGAASLARVSEELAEDPGSLRVRQQWVSVYGALVQGVAALTPNSSADQEILARVRTRVRGLGDSVDRVRLPPASDPQGPSPAQGVSRGERLLGPILADTQAIMSDTRAIMSDTQLLHETLDRRHRAAHEQSARWILAITAAPSLVLALVAFLISRSVLGPLARLQRATETIAMGDLDTHIGATGADELSRLGQSFDRMAVRLKQTLASRDELNQQVRERLLAEQRLERQTADLSRSNEELQQFAYVASHDLQEPLRMVASYLQLLERRYKGRLDADADEFIGFAVDGATRMKALINALLTYSRVGTQAKPRGPTDMERVLRDVLTSLGQAIHDQDARITHDPLPVVSGDATQLGQLLQNLVANAVKFRGADAPEVHVSAQRYGGGTGAPPADTPGGWLFSVRDNGIGIDPRYSEQVYGIFKRLHGQREYPGSGIGLAVCRKIVIRHGGSIWLESAVGEGATFFFSIPDPLPDAPETERPEVEDVAALPLPAESRPLVASSFEPVIPFC